MRLESGDDSTLAITTQQKRGPLAHGQEAKISFRRTYRIGRIKSNWRMEVFTWHVSRAASAETTRSNAKPKRRLHKRAKKFYIRTSVLHRTIIHVPADMDHLLHSKYILPRTPFSSLS